MKSCFVGKKNYRDIYAMCMEKSWKLYESENSENLDDHLHYIDLIST